MANFNLYLLNSDSHSGTEEFLNTLGSYFFNPHILQPTSITHHSATLIDNVFINSITRHTISGNVVYDLTDHLPIFSLLTSSQPYRKVLKYSREILLILMNYIFFKISSP